MTCQECQSVTVAPKWNRYDPNCIYCGARLLRQLGTLNIPKDEIQKRRTKVLTDWVKQGHNEDEIRNLLRSGPWIKPKEKNAKKGEFK
jgi:DNA recombination-dependent growth factor C